MKALSEADQYARMIELLELRLAMPADEWRPFTQNELRLLRRTVSEALARTDAA